MVTKDCPANNPESIVNLFPENSVPEDKTFRWECPDYSWQSSPSKAVDILTGILIQYFSTKSNFTDEELYNLIAKQNPVITSMTYIDEKQTGQLPKIAVDFAGGSQEPNMRFGTDNQVEYNIHNSTGYFYDVWNLQFKIDIVAATKREVLLLMEAVCKLFNHYKSKIREVLASYQLLINQLSGVQVVGDNAENGFAASITITTTVPDVWYLEDVAPRTKRIQNHIVEE